MRKSTKLILSLFNTMTRTKDESTANDLIAWCLKQILECAETEDAEQWRFKMEEME